ncbi:MAG: hypothetical protein CME59_18045 [Halioglobus sp.]|nr:hypothetical protein [Halioglobus sp.]
MPERQRGRPLRLLAAALVAASGAALVAALWLRPLTAEAVLDALLGAVYLILGIGLLGRSRFSLVLGIVIPGAVATALSLTQSAAPLHTLRLAADCAIALCCALALWRLRHTDNH